MDLYIGAHVETIQFIMAQGMIEAMVLRLKWVKKWNPSIDWEGNQLKVWRKVSSQEAVIKVIRSCYKLLIRKVKEGGTGKAWAGGGAGSINP